MLRDAIAVVKWQVWAFGQGRKSREWFDAIEDFINP